MDEIILCNLPIKTDLLSKHCGIEAEKVVGLSCQNPEVLNSYTPYLIGESPSPAGRSLLQQLASLKTSRELTNLSLSLGGGNVFALADITTKLQEFNVGLTGAATSVYANRMGVFGKSVMDYQKSLIAYRKVVQAKTSAPTLAKQKIQRSFQKLQRNFRHELNVVNAQSNSKRGTVLSNPVRASNIARSSRNVTKLNVANQVQANNLVKFARHAKYLGNGLAVIDFSSRIGNIHNSYKSGGNWERDLFIESSSFAVSAIAATIAVKTGLALLIVLTPVGWVGLVMGGLAIAGIAAGGSMAIDSHLKKNAGSYYDTIMNVLN